MRITDYHKKDNKSVLKLHTPIQQFKAAHSDDEYAELMSFYKTEEWQTVERESLNSDRRYYEGRKVTTLLNDGKLISGKRKYYEPEPFQLRIESKLCKRFEDLTAFIDTAKQKSSDVTAFVSLVRKYEHITKLTHEITHELIEKIVVYEADKSNGKRIQQIDIYYRFDVAVSTVSADTAKYGKKAA